MSYLKIKNAGDGYDNRCDIFSFGCLIYFLFVGESPIVTDAITQQISYNTATKIKELENEILIQFMNKLLSGVGFII